MINNLGLFNQASFSCKAFSQSAFSNVRNRLVALINNINYPTTMDLADATGAETSLFKKGRLLVATPTDESAPDLNIGTDRSLRNEGQADLSAKNHQIAGTEEIAGFTLYKGMNLVAGGANKVLESGYEKGDNLTVNAGGTQTV